MEGGEVRARVFSLKGVIEGGGGKVLDECVNIGWGEGWSPKELFYAEGANGGRVIIVSSKKRF